MCMTASCQVSDTPVPSSQLWNELVCKASSVSTPDPSAPSEALEDQLCLKNCRASEQSGCFSRAGAMSENNRKIHGVEGQEQRREEEREREIIRIRANHVPSFYDFVKMSPNVIYN